MNKLKKSEIFLIVFLITTLYPIEFDRLWYLVKVVCFLLYIGLMIYRIKKGGTENEIVRK